MARVRAKPIADQNVFEISGKTKDGKTVSFNAITSDLAPGSELRKSFDKVTKSSIEIQKSFPWTSLMWMIFPAAFFIFIFFMLSRSRGQNVNGANPFKFAKSGARLSHASAVTVTFDDVAGQEEAKEELREVVEFLRFPARFLALGAKIPKGVLLIGPPGCGKTLMAKAIAGEASVPFFSISGSEFVEMFVGVGASRVRDLFAQAKQHAPCIIFVDEIDAVGRHRGAGIGGSHDEREQTLNQILVEMDGFDTSTNVIVIAATNRPDILDPALLRPGRFDRKVILAMPDVKEREAILTVHTKGKPISPDVNLRTIAKQTSGFTGADIANLVNEAAILSVRKGANTIGNQEFSEAIDRVIAGPERKSRVISKKEKEIKAYHEAGHALVAHHTAGADQVQKISIVSRGLMGGYTRFAPEDDRLLQTKKQLQAELSVALAGRAAEETMFGRYEISTGASNDLERATEVAMKMVKRWGMSDKLGPRVWGKTEGLVFLGKELAEERNYSEKTSREIDEEIGKFLKQAKEAAEKVISDREEMLKRIAQYLIEHETLEGEELEKLLNS